MLACLLVLLLCLGACDARRSYEKKLEGLEPAAALVAQFECARCHGLSGAVPDPPLEYNCAGCHQAIHNDAMGWRYRKADVASWKEHSQHYVEVPTLVGVEGRLRREWFVEFLLAPHSVRPHLPEEMPRLKMDRGQAELMASYFYGPDDGQTAAPEPDWLTEDLVAPGRALFESQGCTLCHGHEGQDATSAELAAAKFAPHLRHVRERMTAETAVRWIQDPAAFVPDALMPGFDLSLEERRQLVAYLFLTPWPAPAPVQIPERLPVLEREVSFNEVALTVFVPVCIHCHAPPQAPFQDGGPGSTGGFGYPGRGLDLTSYEGIKSGILDEAGQRQSVLEADATGVPGIVAALMARFAERAGSPLPGITGMPLGLPPNSLEDIQLVETWIAQGARP